MDRGTKRYYIVIHRVGRIPVGSSSNKDRGDMHASLLQGKKILIVDDEPDVLETLTDLLDMCDTETARDFDTATKLPRKKAL